MKFHKQVRALPGSSNSWRRVRLSATVPRDPLDAPYVTLFVTNESARGTENLWIESWDAEQPLPEPADVEKVYEWLLGAMWDRLDR